MSESRVKYGRDVSRCNRIYDFVNIVDWYKHCRWCRIFPFDADACRGSERKTILVATLFSNLFHRLGTQVSNLFDVPKKWCCLLSFLIRNTCTGKLYRKINNKLWYQQRRRFFYANLPKTVAVTENRNGYYRKKVTLFSGIGYALPCLFLKSYHTWQWLFKEKAQTSL